MSPGAPARRRVGRLLLAAAAASLFPGCARRPLVSRGAPVVIISVDTLRADRLPAYGYREVETPALDALARDAIVFENAVSHVPLTLPSHASLFTGLLPFQNGVRDNLGYRLDASRETLAAFLSARGYAAGAAVSAIVLDHGSGVARGFDYYDDRIEASEPGQAIGQVQRSGGESAKRLEGWVSGLAPGKPFFAFLHLYEPHTPYAPPEPWRTRYPKSPYDGEIAASDEIVGRWIAYLKERGVYDRALIVFLSDHGEGLGDHGEDEHGILLYREAVRVPLFVKLPGGRLAGTRSAAPAAIVDVFPTVAAVLGEKPPPELPGVSLADLARDPGTPRSRLQRDALPALPLRLERPRLPDRRPPPVHPGPALRALRLPGGSGRAAGSRLGAAAGVPQAAGRALGHEPAAPAPRRLRSRDRQEARLARLHRVGLAGRRREGPARSEGPDRVALAP